MLAGLAWFAPVWAGWEQGPLVVRSIGMVTAGLVLPLLAHVMLAYPTGRLPTLGRTGGGRRGVRGAAVFSLAPTLVRDPFFDPYCWANCTGNVFVVRSLPDVARADRRRGTVVHGHRGCRGGRALPLAGDDRVPTGPSCLGARRGAGRLLAAAVAAHGVSAGGHPVEDPAEPAFRDVFVLQCSALLVLATALVWGLVRTRLQQRAVARIASSLGEAPAPGPWRRPWGAPSGTPLSGSPTGCPASRSTSTRRAGP